MEVGVTFQSNLPKHSTDIGMEVCNLLGAADVTFDFCSAVSLHAAVIFIVCYTMYPSLHISSSLVKFYQSQTLCSHQFCNF